MTQLTDRLKSLMEKANEPRPTPLPEQDTRVEEAGAARIDVAARRAWRARVEAAQIEAVNALPHLLQTIEAQAEALQAIIDDFETDFMVDGKLVDEPDGLLILNYRRAVAALNRSKLA